MRRSFTTLAATLILSTAFSAVTATAAPVRIAIVSRTVFYVPVRIADRLGYFKAEGIEPTTDVYEDVSEAGLAYVFGSLQSAGLIAREQQFDFAKIVDQRYLVQSRVPNDRGTVRR